jgi:hypothetical protein
MISAILSSSSASWWVWETLISLAAGAGGVLVFWGLWMEGPPDEKPFPNIDAFRRHKAKAKRGWNLLMLGIFVEIIVAVVFAARDGWQARQTANDIAKNDPLNQTVADLTVLVKIKVKGSNHIESPHWGKPSVAGMMLCAPDTVARPGTNVFFWTRFPTLVADTAPMMKYGSFIPAFATNELGLIIGPAEDARQYVMHFHRNMEIAASQIDATGNTKAIDLINSVNVLRIDAKFLPHDSEVLEGWAKLFVNGIPRKMFVIFPQFSLRSLDALGTVPGDSGFSLIATNWTNPQ